MKALAINGSPRQGGNTEILLGKALDPLAEAGHETRLVRIGGTGLRGCTACGVCKRNRDRRCVIAGDGFNEVFAAMVAADAILIGSPTYFGDVTAETKGLLDRAGRVARANGGLFRRKIGAAVAAVRRGGALHVVDSINHLFLSNQMIVPGSTYWNFGLGLEPGDVLNDAEGLANMRDLGEQIAWLMKLMEKNA
ncbi:MAG: flavodoxin family protein [Kiritimatiellae bacterium]|mgnify:CR=1 FL=1|nr:flavodoxin family protein [Kiritimatiellia bacterium]NLD90756.1 flavodoxin family protein [Lentisphaerota bacterium]HPC18825.1 flavodoxin family protein [Kiritimatiellia bacterium]HQN80310.1 flavodoxin family protein [Kiritimatiellia bacterium]HQQ60195.1 flavodoxin family protein [Kiritimatiellia bacterium]